LHLEQERSAEEDACSNNRHHLDRDLHTRGGTGATAATGTAAWAGRTRGLTRTRGSGSLRGLTSEVGTIASKTNGLAGTVVHVLLSLGRHGRQGVARDLPLLGRSRALGSRAAGLVVTVASRVAGGGKCLLQAIEVVIGINLAVRANLNKSVAVGLNGVLVGQTTGVNASHVGGVQGLDFAPVAGVDVAAVFREEDRLAVVLVKLDLLVPARFGEVRGVAPGVVVESEEIGALIIRATVEVEGLLLDVLGDIGGRVTNGDLTGRPVANIALHITSDGLNVGSSTGVVTLVDDLVAREEKKEVVVAVECINCSKDILQVDVVVRAVESGIRLAVERVVGSVSVESQVDSGVIEHLHTLIVVLGVVDCVDTDCVDTEGLEVGNITLQALNVEEGVFGVSRTTCLLSVSVYINRERSQTGLVGNTANVETLVTCEESIALHFDGRKLSL
jgi:hypothetical protein